MGEGLREALAANSSLGARVTIPQPSSSLWQFSDALTHSLASSSGSLVYR